MIMVIDATERDTVLLGCVDGKKHAASFVPTSSASFDILGSADRFLHHHSFALTDVKTVVVASGPGRFSGLRLTAVLANTLHWSAGVRLKSVQGTVRGKTLAERVLALVKRSTPVRTVKPFYGKPPSITRPHTKRR